MTGEYVVAGTLIYGEEFEVREGYVVVAGRVIREVGFGRCDADIRGIVCPAFVDAHTHLGDAIVKDPPFLPLEELVAPPDGLKHRVLGSAAPGTIAEGMRSALGAMLGAGAVHCIDFREGGAAGARLLRDAAGGRATVLGRPAPGDSVDGVLAEADGVGISSTRDLPPGAAEDLAEKAKRAGKIVGVHAGERDRGDIDAALGLSPDFIVHMTRAGDADIRAAADRGIPVVACPRSNAMTGAGLPPLKKMREAGVALALGTDNVMLDSPDMFREMEWADKLFLHDDREVLRMATANGARLARRDAGAVLPGKVADLIVFDAGAEAFRWSRDLVGSVVRRAGPGDIGHMIQEGKVCRRSSGKY